MPGGGLEVSTWRPIVLLCDASGCRAQWVASDGLNVRHARLQAAEKGWMTRGHNDHCPDHPPEQRPRSVWWHGAHAAVQEALKLGLLVRKGACELCSSDIAVVAHHDDYKRPLDVRWLCGICHTAWHQEHGHGANYFALDDEHA